MLDADLSELGQRGGGERIVSDTVDFARQAVRGLEQRLDGGGLEQRPRTAGELQTVGDIGGQLLAG